MRPTVTHYRVAFNYHSLTVGVLFDDGLSTKH